VCDRVGGYGLGTMVVISGLCAGRGLCGLRRGSGGMGGRLRRMEARSCCVGLAGWLREAMEIAGGVSAIGTSTGISVDEVSWEGDETMVMAEVSGWGKASIVDMLSEGLIGRVSSGGELVGGLTGKASLAGIVVVIEGSDAGIVPSTMAVVGGVSVVNVRLASGWRLMMRAWRMRLRAR